MISIFANKDNIFTAISYVIPLAVFFPLQTTGDFFGQWNNLFMWSAVATGVWKSPEGEKGVKEKEMVLLA